LGGATALIAPKINTSLEQKVSQVSINNSNETDHSSKEIASEVKNTSQQKSSPDYSDLIAEGFYTHYYAAGQKPDSCRLVPKEIGGEKCTEIFEGEDLAGRLMVTPNGTVFVDSEAIKMHEQGTIDKKKLLYFLSERVIFTSGKVAFYLGNTAFLRGRSPNYSSGNSVCDIIDEGAKVPREFSGKWKRIDQGSKDNFFPTEIEYDFDHPHQAFNFYNPVSGGHQPIKIRGIPDKNGKITHYGLIYYDGLSFTKEGMKDVRNPSRDNPPTFLASLNGKRIILENQFGKREYSKQE